MVHMIPISVRCPGLIAQHLYYRVRTCRFDIQSFDFETGEDEPGMLRTVSSVNQLISAEIETGIAPGRIVIGGFSQGAAISVLTALTNDCKLAGVACLSGWILMRHKLKAVGRLSCPLGNSR
jgi:predicted esterase